MTLGIANMRADIARIRRRPFLSGARAMNAAIPQSPMPPLLADAVAATAAAS
ncbi:hypothetical protein [Sphingomonas sp. DC1600-2]|uniref:hypothetical protein n=1 Tax=unclassified Sphingomonas TaxID=196159 RepID=UPI0026D7CA03